MELTCGANDWMDSVFRDKLLSALALEIPYADRLPVEGGRKASVLFLFGKSGGASPELSVLITRRTTTVGSHKGQMAFPGGVSEVDELGAFEDVVKTALRETEEEVGIPPSLVEVMGTLPPMNTITGFQVVPVVGLLSSPIEHVNFSVNPDEIADLFWVPLRTLMSPETYRAEFKRVGDVSYPIHVYQVSEHRIWGATGSMIKNLLDRLQALG